MAKDIIENEVEVAVEKPVQKEKVKTYKVSFNKNRSFELHLGRKILFFEPYSSQIMKEHEINHPDFKQQSKYFNVREEK